MKRKTLLLPIAKLIPTEYLISQDKLDEILSHYDGSINSIRLIVVMESQGEYYIENGNNANSPVESKSVIPCCLRRG